MTRLLLFLVYNWPLKLAAIVLATLLYGVIVVTQDSRQIPVTVPIEARNQPDDLVRVSNLGSVQEIRYLAPDDVPANSSSFRATVDFAGLNGRDETVLLGVDVTAIDDRIRVISWEPRQINVSIDRLGSREVRISAIRDGELPEGLDVREPQLETDMAEIRGPSSAVARVARVEASYQVEPNGLDIDRVVDLVPVDAQGERVQQVDVEPAAIHVRVAVFQDGQTRTVPVTPLVTGEPAPGFELASVEVDPLIVTVEGDGEQLTTVNRAETERIPLGGATGSFQRTVQLVLPTGILAVGSDEVRVTVTLRPVTASRTFDAGVFLDGARSDLEYALSTGSVLAIVGGSPGDLARLQGATFRVQANVAGLAPGVHEVSLAADLPAGLALLSTSPTAVTVTITDPRPPSPSPAASP